MAYLTLSDGTIYEGRGFGYKGDVIGEVVFNTGMSGYQELLTDPSYVGQIVNMTYPLIGNYGVNRDDVESDTPHVKGFVVRDYCEVPSNWQCTDTLDSYLKENKVVALQGIDTRALTRKLRDKGTMVGIISQEMPTAEQMLAVRSFRIVDSVRQVTTREAYEQKSDHSCGLKVAVLDYGLKRNILASLKHIGLDLKVFPSNASYEEIMTYDPDGIMLTNGPGDPKDNPEEIATIRKLIGKKPLFGICLGHQLLALAMGANTVKLKYGHRGSNHPVKDIESGRVYITSQNHGYAVDEGSIAQGTVTHVNGNDKTVEGIEYPDQNAFSVQFHPEARPGPNDTTHLFVKFKEMMIATKENENAER